MLATHVNTLRWIYRKNTPDLVALLRRNYPRFVFERQPAPLRDELPVFTFHTVEPRCFETTLAFLAHNGYRTLSAEEFQLAVAGDGELAPASVLLTFDDGLDRGRATATAIRVSRRELPCARLHPGNGAGDTAL